MSFAEQLAAQFPDLKKKLRMAHLETTPELYIKEKLTSALILSVGLGLFCFFVLTRMGVGIVPILLLFLVLMFIIFSTFVKHVDVLIRKREKDIDREVLFAGRFLLIKLNTGQPLINAIVEASKSYGVANKYFKEIVREIELGTPLEKALELESYYTPSQKFRKILFQITTALKIGIDVTNFLSSILDEISEEQLIEIQRYGKKLNSLTLFYMLMAIVIPSLGVTIFIVIASLINLNLELSAFLVIIFVMMIVQFIFLSLFKTIRPDVNI
ncbi:MAG: type II secretion system F family protein [Nanoarchaeota archaeon]